jgi:phosphatidylinositol kinase/protein kinase (PI-3  family)
MTVLEVFKHDPLYAWYDAPFSDFPADDFSDPIAYSFFAFPPPLRQFDNAAFPSRCISLTCRTGDPDKLQRAQGGGRIHELALATGQEKAERVLSRIRQKLRGDLSVEYTVNMLIMEARDTESLARIFVGELQCGQIVSRVQAHAIQGGKLGSKGICLI